MTATISQIRAGIKANLAAVYTDPWSVSSYMQASPNPPSMDISPAHPVSIEYDLAMNRGSDCLYFIIRVISAGSADIDWQSLLDGIMDPASSTSLKAAVEADKTLDGLVSWCRVVKASGYHTYAIKGALEPSPGVEFTVEVRT